MQAHAAHTEAKRRSDRAIREALARCDRAFNRQMTPEQESRAQIQLAKAALAHGARLRAYDMRCFPGIYRRDRAVSLRASVARLELAARRRRYAAELLARAASSTSEQKAA